MHYGPTAFSKNGQPTIEPREKGVRIGQRVDFSPVDVYKVNKLYACPNTPSEPPRSSHSSSSSAFVNHFFGQLFGELRRHGGNERHHKKHKKFRQNLKLD